MATKKAKEVKKIPVPFQDRVIIAKKKPSYTSPGGLILPDSAVQEEPIGYVVAVGPTVGNSIYSSRVVVGEKQNDNIPKVGDLVYYGDYAGKEITVEGDDYLVMREADILCKL
jgi:chaperonin GroES